MQSQQDFVYFFTIPRLSVSGCNCNGTVVALEFCYYANLNSVPRGQNQAVFDFLIVARSINQFSVSKRITVRSIPNGSRCRSGDTNYCCDTTALDASDQFELSSSSFTFGVQVTRMNVRPLAFTSTVTKFNVNQFQSAVIPSSNVYTLSVLLGRSLQFLRFKIGITIIITCSVNDWNEGKYSM